MPNSFQEKLRSLAFQSDRKQRPPKTTTDVHDAHTVDVTEHWSDRVDVTVKPDPVRLKITQES